MTPSIPELGGYSEFDGSLYPPEEAGMTRAGVDEIGVGIQRLIDTNVINGAVSAVARNGKLVRFEAQGWRDPVAGVAMRHDDIFRTMSSTKPINAVAVLLMLEEGRLSLEDKVSRFIPSFTNSRVAVGPPGTMDADQVLIMPADREITVGDLLTHTSGLTGATDKSGASLGGLVGDIEPRRLDDTLATYIERIGFGVLDFQPGSRWAYSAFDGSDTLLRIVEIASGQPADVFLRERLFEPLGMPDTAFQVPPEKRGRLVDIYAYEEGTWRVKPDFLLRSPSYFSGGGGLFSTVGDYLRFCLMLAAKGSFNGHRILKASTVELMAANHVGDKFTEAYPDAGMGLGYGHGLGVRVVVDAAKAGGRPLGAFGWPGAYSTDAFVAPAHDLAAVVFVQILPLNFRIGHEFGAAVGRAIQPIAAGETA